MIDYNKLKRSEVEKLAAEGDEMAQSTLRMHIRLDRMIEQTQEMELCVNDIRQAFRKLTRVLP